MSPIDSSLRADVLIVGGGLVGLTLAISAAQSGFEVVLVDRDTPDTSTSPQFDGRVSSVAAGSANLFKALRVWETILPGAQPIHQIRVSDREAPRFLHYDSSDLGGQAMGYIVENQVLRRTLHLAVEREDRIVLRSGASLEKIVTDPYRATALLSDGTRIGASLIVAADG